MVAENHVWSYYLTVSHSVGFKKILFEFFTIFFLLPYTRVWIISVRMSVLESWENSKNNLNYNNETQRLRAVVPRLPRLEIPDKSTSLFWYVCAEFLLSNVHCNKYYYVYLLRTHCCTHLKRDIRMHTVTMGLFMN